MSLNKLVGGDCGGNNSLVQLSNIVGRDAALSQPLTLADKYVSEFMAQNHAQGPQTFNMNSLLNNMPESESHKHAQIKPGPSSSMHMSKPWMPGPSTSFLPQRPMMANLFMPPQPLGVPQPFVNNVQIQYMNESELQNDNVRAKAQEYVDETKEDDNLAYNQFMSFMKKISAGELNFEPAQPTETEKNREQLLDEMSEKYKEEWQKLSDVDLWDSNNGIAKEYEFAEGNVMLENKSALELGKEKLKMGDVPGAVICFEAAAQQQPDSALVWFLLGSTQAENEQDPLAITALRKCVELEPAMQDAYLTLAAAYANENMPKHAYFSLLDWLKNSPKYNNLTLIDFDTKNIDLRQLQVHVRNLYLDAARRDPEKIDANVQNALGVVFNISQEYEKAVDCFKTALMVEGNNAQLWNRLGATLANSNRSEEAVDAYHEALNLEPGFVRARYNVGITCMNLSAHRQAAEHFLVALNQQNKAESLGLESNSTTSPAIWMTLRMVCSYMGEHKIAELVDQKNLTELNKFFEIDA